MNRRLLLRLAAVLFALASALHGRPGHAEPVERLPHVSVEAIGRGSPVILIPGLSIGRESWRTTADRLARTHRVWLVEVNGFGGSAPGANLRPGILDGVVADLAGLIAREKMAKPAVIGHSMGGLVGMMLAARHPDRIGRLMVVDALPFFGTIMGGPGATPASIEPAVAAARNRVAATPRSAVPVTADPGGIWSNTEAGRIRVAEWSRTADPRVIAQALYEDATTDVTPLLGRIVATPFTVLYATGAGPAATALWTRAYAGSPARLEPVADSYHFIMLDQPAAFDAAVDRFLKG